jgi:hypothetical protein
MTEKEVEIVAEELAKIGGAAWYPGRQQGPFLREVTGFCCSFEACSV